jgi:hypothetical protein
LPFLKDDSKNSPLIVSDMKEEIENGELLFIKVIGNLKAKSKISVN